MRLNSRNKSVNTLQTVVGLAVIAGSLSLPLTSHAGNPFVANDLGGGYQLAGKVGEGKCGEGKCGGEKPAKAKEGKCGEGKCGGEKPAKAQEGKCGEGKCGGSQ